MNESLYSVGPHHCLIHTFVVHCVEFFQFLIYIELAHNCFGGGALFSGLKVKVILGYIWCFTFSLQAQPG